MPLMPGKSKKAFEKNVKTEMDAGKPQDQSLAIAYSVKRKNRKKKASGGTVESGSKDMNYAEGGEVNAKNERRPMPDNRYDDSKMASRNSGNKPAKNDSWTDTSTIKQAQSNNGRSVKSIKYPKMVPQNLYSTRLRDEEDDLQSSASPGPYDAQPPQHDNEEDASKSGHPLRDMESQHNNKKPPYKQAIEDQYSEDMAEDDMKQRYAAGGMAIEEDRNERKERQDEAHMQSELSPSESEGMDMAESLDEEGQDRQGPSVPDMEDEHSTDRKPYAGGGRIGDSEENMDHEMELNPAHDKHSLLDEAMNQPADEEELEHAASIAGAIMARRKKLAKGGMLNGEDSIYAHPEEDQADLSRNAEEDMNLEDQSSFDAMRKENYSESEGLAELDSPMDSGQHGDSEESESENVHDRDMISAIRRKMKIKSAISR